MMERNTGMGRRLYKKSFPYLEIIKTARKFIYK